MPSDDHAPEAPTKEPPLIVPEVIEPKIPGFVDSIRDYFLGEDPTFAVAVVPCCFLAMALFTRHPFKTNFIFDEQEALLANPYVRSIADPIPKFHWLDAFRRDFWGLPPDCSIGSYRPIPDLVWRALWGIGARDQSPFLHHWVNVLLHGVNGALMTLIAFRLTRDRLTAWLTGGIFVACAVLTEAVTGVVGIADVLGALGALLALMALALNSNSSPASPGLAGIVRRSAFEVMRGMIPVSVLSVLRKGWMPLAVFAATLFGLFSKESALVCVPLVPFAALMTAQITHPEKPMRWVRAGTVACATVLAFVLYVEARHRLFPAPIQSEFSVEANVGKPVLARTYHAMLRWYAQPVLPRDPLNNPLINATAPYRIAGALRVYARGLSQIVFPWTLSGTIRPPKSPSPRGSSFRRACSAPFCSSGRFWRASCSVCRDGSIGRGRPNVSRSRVSICARLSARR